MFHGFAGHGLFGGEQILKLIISVSLAKGPCKSGLILDRPNRPFPLGNVIFSPMSTILKRLRAICNHPFFDKGETSDPITDTDITDAIKKATHRFVSKFIPSILCQILFVINFETD